jgi:DNA polymerase (family 10)
MTNRELAEVFEEMADILEIKGDNPFRIRSYRRVAEALGNLGFDAAHAATEDPERLRAVPGIGEGTVRKLAELAATGHCEEHQQLRSELPASLLTMLQIQGLGPKKIALVWSKLNIATIDELEAAARAQRLRSLPGLGEKSESNLLKAIEEHRRRQGRFQLDYGIEVSQAYIAHLRERNDVTRIAAAGSLRRRRETIGDLDILATCPEPARVVETFVHYPAVRDILAQGDTKASVVLQRGLQVDLRVLEDSCFGAAMQYFTGSKEHNVALRERAKRMGLKVSEYGLFRSEDNRRIAGESEEEIYRLLGLAFIPPELRENRGEIELAESGRLPQLIEQSDLRGDLHMHTVASDGRDSLEDMAAAAQALGYEYIAITEHSKALAMAQGLDEERLMRQGEAIDRLNSRLKGFRVLKGIEVDILADGSLDLTDRALASLDVVIASVHSRFNLSEKEMTDRVCRALQNPHVNILAHPTGRLLTKRDPYDLNIEEVIRTASANRVALELNAYPDRLDLKDVHCRMACELGALVAINTDSHETGMLSLIAYGVFTARRGWLSPHNVLNTFPLDRLQRVLAKQEYPSQDAL